MGGSRVQAKLPRFLISCRTVQEFWSYISSAYGKYREQREHLWQEFAPVLEMLEMEAGAAPVDDAVTEALATGDSAHVRDAGEKALERRGLDPDGAITSARTLIECVYKYILEKMGCHTLITTAFQHFMNVHPRL